MFLLLELHTGIFGQFCQFRKGGSVLFVSQSELSVSGWVVVPPSGIPGGINLCFNPIFLPHSSCVCPQTLAGSLSLGTSFPPTSGFRWVGCLRPLQTPPRSLCPSEQFATFSFCPPVDTCLASPCLKWVLLRRSSLFPDPEVERSPDPTLHSTLHLPPPGRPVQIPCEDNEDCKESLAHRKHV